METELTELAVPHDAGLCRHPDETHRATRIDAGSTPKIRPSPPCTGFRLERRAIMSDLARDTTRIRPTAGYLLAYRNKCVLLVAPSQDRYFWARAKCICSAWVDTAERTGLDLAPFGAWRDWKILRAIALWVAAILGAIWIVNGTRTLTLFFLHVLPLMSSGIVDINNRSLGSVFQVYGHGYFQGDSSIGLVRFATAISALVLCCAAWLSQSKSEANLPDEHKLEIISIFLLLSCCVAPVSWIHAYVLSAPILLMLGERIWERHSTTFEAALWVLFLLSLSFTRVGYFLVATPLFGIALGIVRLRGLRTERLRDQPASQPRIFRLQPKL